MGACNKFVFGSLAVGIGLVVLAIPARGLASTLSDLASTVQPGQFAELEVDGPITTCLAMVPPADLAPGAQELGNILQFTDEALWDPVGREIYIMGSRRPYRAVDKQFVKYSEALNRWIVLDRPPFNPGFHGYDHGAIDSTRRVYYRSQTGDARRVWSMDMTSGVWRPLPRVPMQRTEQTIAMDYFPEIDKLVYFNAFYDAEYALYSADTDTWERTSIVEAPFGSLATFSEYNKKRGVMIFGGGFHYTDANTPDPTPGIDDSRRVYMLDPDRVVSRLADAPTWLGQGNSGPVQTIDPISGNLVVFQGIPDSHPNSCPDPLPIYELDLVANTWRQTGTQRLFSRWCDMDTAAVPLDEYGVIFVVTVKNDTDCRVYLYRHSAGSGPGLDAGVSWDAGDQSDGGVQRDGGFRTDANIPTDAEPPGGCQCDVPNDSRDDGPPWFLMVLVGAILARWPDRGVDSRRGRHGQW